MATPRLYEEQSNPDLDMSSDAHDDEIDELADPALICERREQETEVNYFGFPIH